MDNPVFSVVIPVFNSTESLYDLVDRISKVFEQLDLRHEIIFVDDGSSNSRTWPTLKDLSLKNQEVHAIQLTRNFGKARAVLCGMQHACGEWIITLDDDLQHAPEDIPALLEKWNHDVVIGHFKNKKSHFLLQRVTSQIKGHFDTKILGIPKGIQMSPFKLIKARVVQHMLSIKTTQPFIPALILYATRDIVQAQVMHHPRQYGKSAFNLSRRLKQFSNLIFGNSSVLLRLIAILGVSIAILSFFYGIWLIGSYLTYGRPVPGWTSLMVVTLTLGGMIMFSVGVIGEYLIRIIESVEKRPAYLVREQSNKK